MDKTPQTVCKMHHCLLHLHMFAQYTHPAAAFKQEENRSAIISLYLKLTTVSLCFLTRRNRRDRRIKRTIQHKQKYSLRAYTVKWIFQWGNLFSEQHTSLSLRERDTWISFRNPTAWKHTAIQFCISKALPVKSFVKFCASNYIAVLLAGVTDESWFEEDVVLNKLVYFISINLKCFVWAYDEWIKL